MIHLVDIGIMTGVAAGTVMGRYMRGDYEGKDEDEKTGHELMHP